MAEATTEKEKRNWANVYWQSIFNIPSANQHYWLKKIHEIQDFIAPVDCWPEVEQQLSRAQGKRKATPEIQSVLSKMALVNATVSSTDEKSAAPRRRSKM